VNLSININNKGTWEASELIIPNWLKRIFYSRLLAKQRNICEWICFLFVTFHFICLSEMYTIQIQNQIHAHNHTHKSNPMTLLAIVAHFSFSFPHNLYPLHSTKNSPILANWHPNQNKYQKIFKWIVFDFEFGITTLWIIYIYIFCFFPPFSLSFYVSFFIW